MAVGAHSFVMQEVRSTLLLGAAVVSPIILRRFLRLSWSVLVVLVGVLLFASYQVAQAPSLAAVDHVSAKGKTVLIVGATRGIGFTAAQQLVHKGANVIIAGRGKETLEQVAKEVGASDILEIDLTHLSSVREAARRFLAKYSALDVLVLNAGRLGGDFTTDDGLDATLQVNHLAQFLFV